MRISTLLLFFLISAFIGACQSPEVNPRVEQKPADSTDAPTPTLDCKMQALIQAYPRFIKTIEGNAVVFHDSTRLPWDDGIATKSFEQLVNEPDIEDQFHFPYLHGEMPKSIPKNEDPGRIRNEDFFKKIYGANAERVRANLVDVLWCPKTIGQTIRVTRVNRVDSIIQRISAELDELPEFKKFVSNIGGTFNWRLISGTNRLSMHSFGMTIDINTSCSNYWQWDCSCKAEDVKLGYKNQIPEAVVRIFEKHHFIWGGRWYHYDTMHFEYRPELFMGCE
ncbi:MAG: M15 family metallopeptidase [Flavobacteriales bacterium]